MDNINCENCEAEISRAAAACPHCGHPVEISEESNSSALKVVINAVGTIALVIFAVAIITILGVNNSNNWSVPENNKKPSLAKTTKNDKAIGYATQILESKLKSPSSFMLSKGEVMWSGRNQDDLPSYIVRLIYDAQNGFGAMLRNCKLISFNVKGDELQWNTNGVVEECEIPGLYTRADMVNAMRSLNFSS